MKERKEDERKIGTMERNEGKDERKIGTMERNEKNEGRMKER